MIYEENDLVKIKDVVKGISNYLHDELLIKNAENMERLVGVRNSLTRIASEFAGYVIEASIKLSYTTRVNNHLSDVFIYLRWIVGNDKEFIQTISMILHQTIATISNHVQLCNMILEEFYESFKGLSLNFISITRFREIYTSFIGKIIDQIIKK